MKDYKGIYHNVQDKTESYEFGAHFKYAELYNILKDLQIKQLNEKENENDKNTSNIKTENNEEIDFAKRRKKLKLKTLAVNENKRYLITDVGQKKNEKNEFSIIEEDQENKKSHKRKKIKHITKSVDKVQLPNIGSNSLISLQNKIHNKNTLAESYDAHNLRRKKDKQKTLHFPKINSIYRNNALQESEKNLLAFETKSRFPDNRAIKIYKGSIEDESGNQSASKTHKFPQVNNSNQDEDKKEYLIKF